MYRILYNLVTKLRFDNLSTNGIREEYNNERAKNIPKHSTDILKRVITIPKLLSFNTSLFRKKNNRKIIFSFVLSLTITNFPGRWLFLVTQITNTSHECVRTPDREQNASYNTNF